MLSRKKSDFNGSASKALKKVLKKFFFSLMARPLEKESFFTAINI